MAQQSLDSRDGVGPWEDYEAIAGEAIALLPSAIAEALSLSQGAGEASQRWQVYCDALALSGLEQWMQQRLPAKLPAQRSSEFPIAFTQAAQHQVIPSAPALDDLFNSAITDIEVGQFRLCLIPTGLRDQQVTFAPSLLAYPAFQAHFYVTALVLEEEEKVHITGFLRQDHLREYWAESVSSVVEQRQATQYSIPLSRFESNLDNFLLYLSCLDPAAFPLQPLVEIPATTQSPPRVQPQPTLVQTGDRPSTRASIHTTLLQPLLNIGSWLQQQQQNARTQLEQAMVWNPQPTYTFLGASRSANQNIDIQLETFSAILAELNRKGLQFSDHSIAGYRPISLGPQQLRLCALVEPPFAPQQEWSLLIILYGVDGQPLRAGTGLTVHDEQTMLTQKQIGPDHTADYLYTKVIGELQEQFTVRLSCDEHQLTLPSFTYQMDVDSAAGEITEADGFEDENGGQIGEL